MKRLPAVLAILVAVALVGALAWWLLAGDVEPVRPAPPVPPPPAAETAPATPPLETVPEEALHGNPGPAPVMDDEGEPVDPDAYPWAVPDWWRATEEKLRSRELHWLSKSWNMADLLKQVSEEVGVRAGVGPSLKSWSNSHSFKLKRFDGTAWELLEGLASRHNLQVALVEDGIQFHQRGRAPEDPHFAAGLVQQTITHARERHEGKREEHAAAGTMLEQPTGPVGEGGTVSLRDAILSLGKAVRVPVYVDESLWTLNPEVRFPPSQVSLREVLDAACTPLGASWDVTQRRIVLFRP